MTTKRNWFRAGLVALVLAGALASASTSQAADPRADYIITFKSSVSNAKGVAAIKAVGGSPFFVYQHALNGAAVSLPASAVDALRRRSEIASIELDGPVQTTVEQSGATWGLDRIDQVSLPLDTKYNYNFDGSYGTTPSRVTAYIIDTGIQSSHPEFEGRVSGGTSTIVDGRGTEDCDGHGTHVAGTVGSKTYGVAKNVKLVPVRVLDCTGAGSWSGVIAGIDWVTANKALPAVANLSLGGGLSSSVNNAVTRLVNSGVVVAVAAGNSGRDACRFSPASTPSALTVGATSDTDARAYFSNFGTCLDIFAPGVDITSTVISSLTDVYSGTSMASPHVAGVAALVLAANPSASPATVMNKIVSQATSGKVTSAGKGSPNRLLYSLVS